MLDRETLHEMRYKNKKLSEKNNNGSRATLTDNLYARVALLWEILINQYFVLEKY